MKMDKINELIKEHGWSLLSWQERYGGEVWIAIAPTRNHVDVLEDMNTDGDAESLTLTDYLFEQGSWLPVVRDQTFTTALNRLEAKVNTVPQDLFDLLITNTLTELFPKSNRLV